MVIDSNFNDLVCFPFENEKEELNKPDWVMEGDKWPNLVPNTLQPDSFFCLFKALNEDQFIVTSNNSFSGEKIENFQIFCSQNLISKNFDFKKFYYFFNQTENEGNDYQLFSIRSRITYLFLTNEETEKEKKRIGI